MDTNCQNQHLCKGNTPCMEYAQFAVLRYDDPDALSIPVCNEHGLAAMDSGEWYVEDDYGDN